MARNLANGAECAFCHGDTLVSEGTPVPASYDVCGAYVTEYARLSAELRFAAVHCAECFARYTGWFRSEPVRSMKQRQGSYERRIVSEGPWELYDLSHRRTFNDEPSVQDFPVFVIGVDETGERRRVGLYPSEADPYFEHSSDGERQKYLEYLAGVRETTPIDPPTAAQLTASMFLDEYVGERLACFWPLAEAPKELRPFLRLDRETEFRAVIASRRAFASGVALPDGWFISRPRDY